MKSNWPKEQPSSASSTWSLACQPHSSSRRWAARWPWWSGLYAASLAVYSASKCSSRRHLCSFLSYYSDSATPSSTTRCLTTWPSVSHRRREDLLFPLYAWWLFCVGCVIFTFLNFLWMFCRIMTLYLQIQLNTSIRFKTCFCWIVWSKLLDWFS